MDFFLTPVEVRIIGALIEKQITTPDYYPMTMNALVNACNQLSNRDPVVSYDEKTVHDTLFELRGKRFARMISGSDHRVPKYEQIFTDEFNLAPDETAVMCVLMLRGPQTVGEIRGRTGRLHDFKELAEVEETLKNLAERSPDPLVVRLPRQPGTKESRFAHLLCGNIDLEALKAEAEAETPTVTAVPSSRDRLDQLEREVARLREEQDELKRQFMEFKKQFD